MNTSAQQLEIGIATRPMNPAKRRRKLRAARAQWWFSRMRQVVETAAEWTPAADRAA